MKFTIIGGDAAGMSAASRAKRSRPDLEVVVLEQSLDVSYSACGMPYNIADPNASIEALVVRQAKVFREKQGIDLRTGHRVNAIDTENKTVSGNRSGGDRFQVDYDRLLIATGASPSIPDLPGFDLPGVMPLKSLAHGRQIKAFIEANGIKRAVIVGMGYIALEMCEALRTRGIGVDMVKPRPTFMPGMHPDLAHVVKTELEDHDVALHLGRTLKGIEKSGGALRVITDDGALEGDMVLVAVGVDPNSELAEGAGLELGPSRAIKVDKSLRTSDENIFAAGDCADAFHVVTGERTWIPLALRANRAGWAVADNVTGKAVSLDGIAGTAVFKAFDLQVAKTGLTPKEAEASGFEPVDVMIKSRSRAHAQPDATTIRVHMVGDRRSGRLLGVHMVGKEGVAHRINAPAVGLHQRMTVEAFSQCDLAYAPPFGPTWDPMLTAAVQLLKKM